MNLERRIAQLEAVVTNLKTIENESRLIGRWSVVDSDKTIVAFSDIRFKGDGACKAVWKMNSRLDAQYEVIGPRLSIQYRQPDVGLSVEYTIVAIDKKELVLSWEYEGRTITARYAR